MGVDLFLKLTKSGAPIKGECADDSFVDMIELESFEMSSLALLGRPGGSAPGEDDDGPPDDACAFTVKKDLDASSGDLFLNYTCAQNPERRQDHLLKAKVFFRHDGESKKRSGTGKPVRAEDASFLSLEFSAVFVYDYSLSAEEEALRPTETVKFYFDKVVMTYRDPYFRTGMALRPPFFVGWDFAANQAL